MGSECIFYTSDLQIFNSDACSQVSSDMHELQIYNSNNLQNQNYKFKKKKQKVKWIYLYILKKRIQWNIEYNNISIQSNTI